MAQRWQITLEYDGRGFCGWQQQAGQISVQQSLKDALKAFCQQDVEIVAAGRTDAGVHALGQVVHGDIERPTHAQELIKAVNFHLRRLNGQGSIMLTDARMVAPEFHARFSALYRRYAYVILNRPLPSPFWHGRCWAIPRPLNYPAMQEAASLLVGQHDFTSFRAVNCQAKSALKTLDELTISLNPHSNTTGNDVAQGKAASLDFLMPTPYLVIEAKAKSFLHHQVRNMVGTLVEVGLGRRHPQSMPIILAARQRSAAGVTAPAEGLYFLEAAYPPC